jgi:hypothetical protein
LPAPSICIATDATVELHAADGRQVVALFRIEQAVEQRLHGIFRRRLARSHHAVDRDARLPLVGGFVGAQRLRNVRASVQIVHVEGRDLADTGHAQLGQQFFRDFIVGAGEDFAAFLIDHCVAMHAANEEVFRHHDGFGARLCKLADVLCGDPLVLGNDDLAGACR